MFFYVTYFEFKLFYKSKNRQTYIKNNSLIRFSIANDLLLIKNSSFLLIISHVIKKYDL